MSLAQATLTEGSAKGGRPISPLMQLLLWIDTLAEGRRLRIWLVLAAFQGVIAPMLDTSLEGIKRLGVLRSTATSINSAEFAGFEGVSLAAIFAVLLIGGGVLGGRIAALVAPDEDGQPTPPLRVGVRSLVRLVRTEWRLFRRREAMEQFVGAGFLLFAVLQTTKAILSFFRWITWETVVTWFDLQETMIGSLLEGVYWFEGVISLFGGMALLGLLVALATWAIRRDDAAHASDGRVREVRLLRAENPLIEVGASPSGQDLAAAFHGDVVARVLGALAEWTPPADAAWESDLRDNLAEYLAEREFTVTMEYTLRAARRRIDIVVNRCVAIEIKWELRRAGEKDRARSQVVDYARAWSERGPVIALLVATERPHVTPVAEEAARWNGSFELPTAPILVVSHNRASGAGGRAAAVLT